MAKMKKEVALCMIGFACAEQKFGYQLKENVTIVRWFRDSYAALMFSTTVVSSLSKTCSWKEGTSSQCLELTSVGICRRGVAQHAKRMLEEGDTVGEEQRSKHAHEANRRSTRNLALALKLKVLGGHGSNCTPVGCTCGRQRRDTLFDIHSRHDDSPAVRRARPVGPCSTKAQLPLSHVDYAENALSGQTWARQQALMSQTAFADIVTQVARRGQAKKSTCFADKRRIDEA